MACIVFGRRPWFDDSRLTTEALTEEEESLDEVFEEEPGGKKKELYWVNVKLYWIN